MKIFLCTVLALALSTPSEAILGKLLLAEKLAEKFSEANTRQAVYPSGYGVRYGQGYAGGYNGGYYQGINNINYAQTPLNRGYGGGYAGAYAGGYVPREGRVVKIIKVVVPDDQQSYAQSAYVGSSNIQYGGSSVVQPVIPQTVQYPVRPVVQPVIPQSVQYPVRPVVQPIVQPSVPQIIQPVVQPIVQPVVQQVLQPSVQPFVQQGYQQTYSRAVVRPTIYRPVIQSPTTYYSAPAASANIRTIASGPSFYQGSASQAANQAYQDVKTIRVIVSKDNTDYSPAASQSTSNYFVPTANNGNNGYLGSSSESSSNYQRPNMATSGNGYFYTAASSSASSHHTPSATYGAPTAVESLDSRYETKQPC